MLRNKIDNKSNSLYSLSIVNNKGDRYDKGNADHSTNW